jgi:hypothetical protein
LILFGTRPLFEVLAIKNDTQSVLLHKPVPPDVCGQWFQNGHHLAVRGSIEELLVFDALPDFNVGDYLDFHHHTSTVEEVHQQLLDFWRPRWNCTDVLNDEIWARVNGFVSHFMPKLPLTLPPLTVEDWMRLVKRFRPHAARGADGWAQHDLLKMPRSYTKRLLAILTAVEANQMPWPAQLLEGPVIALAKCDGAHKPNEYRPIVLLSIIYRCWASLRSRQLLRKIEPYIHADAHGFLPSREPAQTWMQVQAAVEVALQSAQPLAGGHWH